MAKAVTIFYRGAGIALCCVIAAASSGFAQQATTPSADSVVLNFPSAYVHEIVPLYESLTHLKVTVPQKLGKISISVAEPVTPETAIVIIERTLFANGFAIVQLAPDTVAIIAGKDPALDTLANISDPSQLPAHERVVSYRFELKHIKATDLREMFTQYLSPLSRYESLVCAKDSNALLVRDRTSVIRQLISVLEKIDVPPAQR